MAKAIITYGVNIENSTGAPGSHPAWRKLPVATLYRLKEIRRQRGYVEQQKQTTNTSIPLTGPVEGPTREMLNITSETIDVVFKNKQGHNQARKALNVTGDYEHDSREGQRPTMQIDITVEDNATLSGQAHNQHNHKASDKAMAITDLQGKDICTSAGRQPEY